MGRLLLPLMLLGSAACGSASTGGAAGGPSTSITPTSGGVLIRLADEEGGVSGLIDAGPAAVWAVMPAVYEALGIRAGALDEREMAYGTTRFTGQRIGDRPTASFVRCAGSVSGPASFSGYRIRLAIRSEVRGQADGHTLLATRVTGSGTTVEGTSTAAVRCVSTGELEELIASVAARLAAEG